MKHFLSFFVLTFISTCSHAEIFQCIDKSGKTIYKDSECQHDEVIKNIIDNKAIETKTNVSTPHIDNSGPLGKNLLKNASFENKLVDWKVPIGAAWSNNQGINTSGGLIIQSEIPPDDKYIHETIVEQCVLLGPGEKFQLKAKFKTENIQTGEFAKNARFANRVNVIWYESTDCTIGGQYGSYIEPKNILGWQNLSGGGLKPAFQAKAAKITIVQNGRYSRGRKGYWDDISFFASEVFERSSKEVKKQNREYTMAINQNYVKNSEFKRNLLSWRAWKAEWSSNGGKSAGSAKVTFKSNKGGMGAGALDQCVNIGENTNFDFGASVKKDQTSTQGGGGRIRVSWNDKENCKGRSKTDSNWADVKDVYGWQDLKVNNLVAPPGTHSVHLELIQSIAGSGRYSMYWDDVYFKAVRDQ